MPFGGQRMLPECPAVLLLLLQQLAMAVRQLLQLLVTPVRLRLWRLQPQRLLLGVWGDQVCEGHLREVRAAATAAAAAGVKKTVILSDLLLILTLKGDSNQAVKLSRTEGKTA